MAGLLDLPDEILFFILRLVLGRKKPLDCLCRSLLFLVNKRFARLCEDPLLFGNRRLHSLVIDKDRCASGSVSFGLRHAEMIWGAHFLRDGADSLSDGDWERMKEMPMLELVIDHMSRQSRDKITNLLYFTKAERLILRDNCLTRGEWKCLAIYLPNELKFAKFTLRGLRPEDFSLSKKKNKPKEPFIEEFIRTVMTEDRAFYFCSEEREDDSLTLTFHSDECECENRETQRCTFCLPKY